LWLKFNQFLKRDYFKVLLIILVIAALFKLGGYLYTWYWSTHPLFGISQWYGHGEGIKILGGEIYSPVLIPERILHDKLVVRWFLFYVLLYLWLLISVVNGFRIWAIGWKSVISYEGTNLFFCFLAVLGWSFTIALVIWGFIVFLSLGTPLAFYIL
jgi:hypothetical protein